MSFLKNGTNAAEMWTLNDNITAPEAKRSAAVLHPQSLTFMWILSFILKSLQVWNQVQTSWSKLNGFKWGQRGVPDCLKCVWIRVIRVARNNIRTGYCLLKICLQWVGIKNAGILSECHGPVSSSPQPRPSPPHAVDVCSLWEKQSAILEASTDRIKKSWIN